MKVREPLEEEIRLLWYRMFRWVTRSHSNLRVECAVDRVKFELTGASHIHTLMSCVLFPYPQTIGTRSSVSSVTIAIPKRLSGKPALAICRAVTYPLPKTMALG